MKNEVENVKLTKEVYLEISSDKTKEIADLKEKKDGIIVTIAQRIEKLKELRKALKEVKNKIKLEKRALRQNKNEKFSVQVQLSKEKKYAKELNKAFSRGDEDIEITRFYTTSKSKTR